MADRAGFDVAVVGAGIGGLAVACLVARTGRSVLLLERAPEVGGVCRPLVPAGQEGLRFDLGATFLSGLQPAQSVGMLCQRLGLGLAATPCEPPFQVALPRHRLSLFSAAQACVREIRRECPADEAAWGSLWADLDTLEAERNRLLQALPPLPPRGWRDRLRVWRLSGGRGRTGPRGELLRQAMGTSFREALERHGFGPIGQRILEACLWFLALRAPEECTALEAILALQPLRRGAMRVAGGAGALVEALAARFGRDGGQLRLGTAVEHLLVERGGVRGVVTTEHETIRARAVVAAVPPTALTAGLLPGGRGLLRPRATLPSPWQAAVGTQMLAVAVPGELVPSALAEHCFVIRRPDQPARDENLCVVRTPPPAPGTHDGLRMITVSRLLGVPALAAQGDPGAELFAAVEELIPGARQQAAFQQVLGPAELGELWGRPAGAVRYAPESREWLGRRGMAHDVGWPGLLVAGDWTFPGRLVADVVEGAMEVADTIIGWL